MDRKFNNRLAGTIIIIALGVICLPSLLNGNKNNVHDEFVTIPSSNIKDNQLTNKKTNNNTSSSHQKSIALPERHILSKPQTWVIQLGALKNATKVSEIVAQLQLSGYPVYTLPSTPIQGQITRILVGPNASKAKLQYLIKELNHLSGLNGKLYPYITRVSTKQQYSW